MTEILSFLTLVPEIRDQIYEHVLSFPIPPPKSPSTSGPRKHLDNVGFRSIETSTYYPKQPFPWPGAGLVRTCRQVRTEVCALARVVENRNRAKRRLEYELDIMIDGESTLYPTWVNLPLENPSEQLPVHQIWADLRTTGVFDPSTRRRGRSGWTDNSSWPPSLVWGLFNMLNRFYEYGTSFQMTYLSNRIGHPGETLAGMKVPHLKELVLNVVTPTEEEMEGRSYADTRKSIGVMRPQKMAAILEDFINYLKDAASHAGEYARRYGLHKKLGKIRLCLDGKEVGSWCFNPHLLGC